MLLMLRSSARNGQHDPSKKKGKGGEGGGGGGGGVPFRRKNLTPQNAGDSTEGGYLSLADALQFVSAAPHAYDGTGSYEPAPYSHPANIAGNENGAYSLVYGAMPDASAVSVLATNQCCEFYTHPLAPAAILPFICGAVVAMFFSGTANGWCVGHVVAILPEPACYPYYVYSVSIALSSRMKYEIYVDGNGQLSYTTSPGKITFIASREVVVLSHMAR
jgi:hypothetical protein